MYRFADISESGVYTRSGDFKHAPVSLFEMDNEKWTNLALTLAGYVNGSGIAPLETQTTGANGEIAFETVTSTGLYLILGENHTADGYLYRPAAFVVSLPTQDSDGNWVYDVTCEAKYERESRPDDEPDSSIVSITAEKVWAGGGTHPEGATMQLYRNGAACGSPVTLHAGNSWKCTWTGLDRDGDYTIAEMQVPEGYTVAVSREGYAFTVTNTGGTDTPGSSDTPATPQKPGSPGTPRTGDESHPELWYGLMAASGCGFAAMLLLYLRRRRQSE